MNRTFAQSAALVLPLLAGLGSCKSFASKQSVGLRQADDLVTVVERVEVEAKLSRESIRNAVKKLHAIVAHNFEGDALEAYTAFAEAIELSEKQAAALNNAAIPLHDAGERFFDRWLGDLEAFNSVEMRQRSEARFNDNRERFDAIVAAVDPARSKFDDFNLELRDHAFFLGNDFNASAVAEIEGEVRRLTGRAADLDQLFAQCVEATRAYSRSNTLHGRIETATRTERNENN